MSGMEMRIPPLALTTIVATAMACTALVWPEARLDRVALPWLGAVIALAGAAVAVAGVAAFRRHRTSVNPLRGDGVATLVDGGVYGWTRNPMYVGFVAWTIGLGVALGHPLAWPGPVVLAAWLTRYQIMPEERLLRERFGPAFDRYCRHVRRWL